MTRLFIGNRPGVGGVVRVMANDADDPVTTPNSDRHKFRFNSEATVLGYLLDIWRDTWNASEYLPLPTNVGNTNGKEYNMPPGSSRATATGAVKTTKSNVGYAREFRYFIDRIFTGYGWPPIIEVRTRSPGGALGGLGNTYYFDSGGGPGQQAGRRTSSLAFRVDLLRDYDWYDANNSEFVPGWYATSSAIISNGLITESVVSVWELPANDAAIGQPIGTPVAGQKNVHLSPSIVKVARPGFDVGSASGRQLILDSTRIPAKVIATGEVTIAAGGSHTVYSEIPLNPDAYLDFHLRLASLALTHPPVMAAGSATSDNLSMSYTIHPDRVDILNSGNQAFMLRYVLFGDDSSSVTAGGSAVFRRGNDGSQDFVQIKRPGSSDAAPSLNDIILDTRLHYPEIVAEGYLPWSAFTETPASALYGEKAKTVNFANGGFKPFLKYTVIYDDKITHPISQLFQIQGASSPWNNRQSRYGTVALLTDTSVKFHMSAQNPARVYFTDDEHPVLDVSYSGDDPPIGIRYYVFALPNSL